MKPDEACRFREGSRAEEKRGPFVFTRDIRPRWEDDRAVIQAAPCIYKRPFHRTTFKIPIPSGYLSAAAAGIDTIDARKTEEKRKQERNETKEKRESSPRNGTLRRRDATLAAGTVTRGAFREDERLIPETDEKVGPAAGKQKLRARRGGRIVRKRDSPGPIKSLAN